MRSSSRQRNVTDLRANASLRHFSILDEAGHMPSFLSNKWNVVKPKLNSMSTAEQQYRPVIAIDFDGTIVEHNFPKIGKLMFGAKEVINEWYDKGYFILIWTCRNNHEPDHPEWTEAPISAVREFLLKNGVKFHGINQQQPGLGFYLESRKIFANIYIDDRNLGGFPGWAIARNMVAEYYARGCDWAEPKLAEPLDYGTAEIK